MVGQIVNGGVEQFIENCPGLIRDAAQLLDAFGTADLQNAYALALQNFTAVIDYHAGVTPDATGEGLTPFWSDFEQARRDDDEDRFEVIEDACYASDRNDNPSNWITHLEQRVLDWVLDNPREFLSKA